MSSSSPLYPLPSLPRPGWSPGWESRACGWEDTSLCARVQPSRARKCGQLEKVVTVSRGILLPESPIPERAETTLPHRGRSPCRGGSPGRRWRRSERRPSFTPGSLELGLGVPTWGTEAPGCSEAGGFLLGSEGSRPQQNQERLGDTHCVLHLTQNCPRPAEEARARSLVAGSNFHPIIFYHFLCPYICYVYGCYTPTAYSTGSAPEEDWVKLCKFDFPGNALHYSAPDLPTTPVGTRSSTRLAELMTAWAQRSAHCANTRTELHPCRSLRTVRPSKSWRPRSRVSNLPL
ncbi:uncharacterized protein [Symphalangus syndactylus]|uniref:uncharacterized protein n=1 Tax=Symphalangus syndactylus TaxID=9590 RepID=UPI002441DBD8|nr:uncharacterized protein LOC129488242 [Symphalangus syndactylus]